MIGSKGTFLTSVSESGHWHFKSIFLEIPGFLQRSFPTVKLQCAVRSAQLHVLDSMRQ